MTLSTLPLPVAIGDYPIGAILSFAGILNRDQIQAQGWLYCNGDSISRTQYADLFAVIGSAFSSGDGVSTFNLPDCRGCFLRGADNGAKVDPDAGSRTASRPGSNTGPIVGSAQSHATGLPRNEMPYELVARIQDSIERDKTTLEMELAKTRCMVRRVASEK